MDFIENGNSKGHQASNENTWSGVDLFYLACWFLGVCSTVASWCDWNNGKDEEHGKDDINPVRKSSTFKRGGLTP